MDAKNNLIEVPFYKGSTIVLNDIESAKKLLLTKDDYIQGLSTFDLQSKMMVFQAPQIDEFMKFQAEQVIPWTPEEIQFWVSLLKNLKLDFEKFSDVPIPEKIIISKTTGKEEGDAAYTRGTCGIFFPGLFLKLPNLPGIVIHEIWHLISRKISTELKAKVYGCIGFKPMGHVMDYPSELVKISNPDAPKIEHFIEVQMGDNSTMCLTPIIYASSPNFDPSLGKSFFKYMQRKLIVLMKGVSGIWAPMRKNVGSGGEIFDIRDTAEMPEDFWEQIGRNTSYMIHPEETIADNFMHLIQQNYDFVETPEILFQLGEIFGQKNLTVTEEEIQTTQ